jgi:hypothetical protein
MRSVRDIQRSRHYVDEHGNMPWHEVVDLILFSRNARKKGNTYVIKEKGCYIVYSVYANTITVINAKRLK